MARVLLVEDETAVLLFAEIVLEGLGYSIVSVSSQTDALALLEAEDLDVLFTDIRLPESDLAGFELARQARDRHPSLKVLYTTGQTVDDRMKALYVDGAAMPSWPARRLLPRMHKCPPKSQSRRERQRRVFRF